MIFFSDFIDLSDESGSLKNLQSHPLDYGTKYLNEREILILVKGESKSVFHILDHLSGNERVAKMPREKNPDVPSRSRCRSKQIGAALN